jgi:hypothetical protein
VRRLWFASILIISLLTLTGPYQARDAVKAEPLKPNSAAIYLPFLQSESGSTGLPSLPAFINSVKNGLSGVVRGVYAAGEFAFSVAQQPAGDYDYVSTDPKSVTQYGPLAETGSIVLLAHNNLAGMKFFLLKKGATITIIFGDGATLNGKIFSLDSYQALDPLDAFSSLLNLDTREVLDSAQTFLKYYMEKGMITFQTCISQDNNPSWGRLFVVAKPTN